MTSTRRGLLSRINVHSSNWRTRALPETVDRYNPRIEDDDDAASIRTFLPPYSPRGEDPYNRPPSPAPSYSSVDTRDNSDADPASPRWPGAVRNTLPKPQAAIDDIVNRLRESLKNKKAWRVRPDGQMRFFWALRCSPGTARLLEDYIDEIQTRTLGTGGYKVEQFSFIYKGQQLGMLWCRPVHTERHGTHVDRLQDDYIVVHLCKYR